MCKIQGVKLGIKDLDFTSHRGKMAVRLTDGREVIIPVSLGVFCIGFAESGMTCHGRHAGVTHLCALNRGVLRKVKIVDNSWVIHNFVILSGGSARKYGGFFVSLQPFRF